MTRDIPWLVDADVLIAAHRRYYSFNVCPGFWKSLVHFGEAGRIGSIDRVRDELLDEGSSDILAHWVEHDLPKGFFMETSTDDVASAYSEISPWVQSNRQYFDFAKETFEDGADGWIVAHAMVNGGVVVTNEKSSPESRRIIKLPDVCTRFDVNCKDTFHMLARLQIRFDWREDS